MASPALAVARHPAKWSDQVLDASAFILDAEWRYQGLNRTLSVLDPFAGTAKIRKLESVLFRAVEFTCVEIEPKWAAADPKTIIGDATQLPKNWTDRFDALCCSPCYGNRLADSHAAKDKCKTCGGRGEIEKHTCVTCHGEKLSRRNTYRHALGEELQPNNAGAMQWGQEYRELHRAAWAEALRVVKPQGLLVVNISNHIRNHKEIPVAEWHLNHFLRLGCFVQEVQRVQTPRNRQGENGEARVMGELILVMRAP